MVRKFFLLSYMVRVPFLTLVALGFVLPETFGSKLFRGLADLEFNQILVVSWGAFMLFSSAMTCAFLVLFYGTDRADDLPPQDSHLAAWPVALMYVVGGGAYLNFLFRVYESMKDLHVNPEGLASIFWLNSLLGAMLGAAVVITAFFIDLWLSSPRRAPELEVFAFPVVYLFRDSFVLGRALKTINDSRPLKIPVRFSRKVNPFLARILGPGYYNVTASSDLELRPGHRFAGILACVGIAIYLMAGAGGHSRLYSDGPFGPPRPYEAVLLQVILLLLLACWLLSGLSFYLDRFRVPVLLFLGFVFFVTSHFGASDHAYHTFPRSDAAAGLPSPKARFMAAPDHVIAIAAAGGGIQAAAWTGQVLCGLSQEPEVGSAFRKSVLVISGVSGGSVGTMFYLRCLEPYNSATNPQETVLNSSLEGIAWGLAHPDLVHAIFPLRNFWWPGDDRGWALERSLRKHTQFAAPDRLLTSPKLVEQWPVLLFNSTELRTGDPMVFTNSDFPKPLRPDEDTHRLHSFHQMYPGRDVLLETAVRMSSTFPFVTPVARADWPWNAEHLGDGGYFENAGIFALGEWLKEAADIDAQSQSGCVDLHQAPKKILVIRIDAFPDSQWDGKPADNPKSWAYQLIAPALGILHIRSEAPQVRGTAESADLLRLLNGRGYEASTFTARYSPEDATAAPGLPKVNCPKDPPLTWRLTEVDKLCIQRDWIQVRPKLAATVREFLTSPVKTATCPRRGEIRNEPLGKGMYVQELKR